ncbi:MAG TPA: hypothetical protein PKG52_02130 [bacterium]|nr:hypothetical protein [bacterium]HPS28669.1 hypothetical protein [bacterium]
MGINVNVTEQQILQGDTTIVRKEFENLVQTSLLIKKFENDVSINFFGSTPLDMIKKLKTEKYRNWFEKLDREVPGAPYFLSQKSNTLLYFLMGNIQFEEKENAIYFDELGAQRFFKEKVSQIKNLCLPNNINPQSGINRLSGLLSGEKDSLSSTVAEGSEKDAEKAKKGVAIKDLLDKYGSIAFMNRDRAVKLTVVVKDIPEKISFSRNCLVKDPKNPQPFFLTIMKTDSAVNEIRSIIVPNISDVEDSLKRLGGVYIQVVTKAEDLSYQSLFESDTIFPVDIVFSIAEVISEHTEIPVAQTVESVVNDSQRTEPEIKKSVREEKPEIVPEKKEDVEEKLSEYDEKDEILRLKAENIRLFKQIEQLQKLVEDYEEEVHKKQSIKGFFGKFFN